LSFACGGIELIIQPPSSDHSHVAQRLRRDDLAGFQEQVVTAALHTDLDDLLRSLLRLDEFHALLGSLTERLLDVHVLARS